MGSYGPDEYLRPVYVQRIDGQDVVVTNDDPKVQKPSGYGQINMMQKIMRDTTDTSVLTEIFPSMENGSMDRKSG